MLRGLIAFSVILALTCRAGAEEPDCGIVVAHGAFRARAGGPPSERRALAPGSEECRALLAIKSDFTTILLATGCDDAANWGDFTDYAGTLTASFDEQSRAVLFSAAALSVFGSEPALRRFAIAHELGHAKQLHDGIKIRAVPDAAESRGYEAQADAFALEFLKAAGFPSETEWDGIEGFIRFYGEAKYLEGGHTDHPSLGARFLNVHAFGHQGSSVAPGAVALGDFNERGILRAELWVPQRLEAARKGVPPPPGYTEEAYRGRVLAEAVKLLSLPLTETTLSALAKNNRGRDLADWVTRQAIEAVPPQDGARP